MPRRHPFFVFCSKNKNKFEEIKLVIAKYNQKYGTKYVVFMLNIEINEINDSDLENVVKQKINDIRQVIDSNKTQYYTMINGNKEYLFNHDDYILLCENIGLGFKPDDNIEPKNNVCWFPGAQIKSFYEGIMKTTDNNMHATNSILVEKYRGRHARFTTSFGVYDNFTKNTEVISHETLCEVSEDYCPFGNGYDFDFILIPFPMIKKTFAELNETSNLAPKPRSLLMKTQILNVIREFVSKGSKYFEDKRDDTIMID